MNRRHTTRSVPRTALAAVGALGVAGCSAVTVDGDRFELTNSPLLVGWVLLLGAALVGVGVLGIAGVVRVGKPPWRFGWLALAAGLIVIGVTATTAPYERITITPERLVSARGFLGSQRTEVDLRAVERIVLYRAKIARDRPRRSEGRTSFAEFVPRPAADGQTPPSTHVKLKEPKRIAAIEHLIELANELGIEVEDQRTGSAYYRYRGLPWEREEPDNGP